jgi:hypothetical protein
MMTAHSASTSPFEDHIESGKPSIYTTRLFAFMKATNMQLTATITARDPEDPDHV